MKNNTNLPFHIDCLIKEERVNCIIHNGLEHHLLKIKDKLFLSGSSFVKFMFAHTI